LEIAVLLYPGFTALDATGPIDILWRLPDSRLTCVSAEPGMVPTEVPGVALSASPLEAVTRPDIILVPGGSTTQAQLTDERVIGWLREAHETSTWTTSVCTGSLLLGQIGALEGRRATSHWYELESMSVFGATPSTDRVVFDGKVVTAAGVSAGIDMALELTERVAGAKYARGVQLAIEYDPQPPHDCGTMAKASPELAEEVHAALAAALGPTWGERQRD
jgi:transcriptional regulator GlxA family with amidase domain